MKSIFLAFTLLATLPLPAQVIHLDSVTTRAVVVGISDYQDEKIPDLRFADKDAEAFAQWLRSYAGGKLPEEDVMLLTNENATSGKIAAGLTWLVTDSKPGDRAVIYFSGHGDVENVTDYQRGYLLAYNSPPSMYMAGGAFEMRVLQDVISTLSQREVQVLMVSDACRAGKLAGSENGGPQATTAALASQFANEVKILSCQPDEFSLEGEQWGGGRGAFSYHLVDGLYGMADQNADLEVNLMELQRYLQDAVPRDAAPQSQLPMAVGNPKTHLSEYDRPSLQYLLAQKAAQSLALRPVESKSFEAMALANADTSTLQLYAAFEEALRRGDLLTPKGTSADDFYRALLAKPEIARLHGLMTRNFAAALVDESQEVTNKLLKSDPYVVSDAISRPFVFDHIHRYIARAIELLGEKHFLYKHLKAKELYFEAKTYRKDNYPDSPADSLDMAYNQKLEEGLRFDSAAAYIYMELAMSYLLKTISGYMEPAIVYAKKAVELSPQSALANMLFGSVLVYQNRAEEGIPYLEKAMALDSTFLPSYVFMGLAYFCNSETSRKYMEKYIHLLKARINEKVEPVPVFYYAHLGHALCRLGRINEAEAVLLKADSLSNGQSHYTYMFLMTVYAVNENWERLAWVLDKLIEQFPGPGVENWLYWQGIAHGQLKQFAKEEETYKRLIRMAGSNSLELGYANCTLADYYLRQMRYSEADSLFQAIIEKYTSEDYPETDRLYLIGRAQYVLHGEEAMEQVIDGFLQKHKDRHALIVVAMLYALAGLEEPALTMLGKVIEICPGVAAPPAGLWMNTEFVPLRHSPDFQALVKKYFPELVKD